MALALSSATAMASSGDARGFLVLEYADFPVFVGSPEEGITRNPQQEDQNLALKLQVEASYRFSDQISSAVRAFVREDFRNNNRDTQRFDELWVQYSAEGWDLRIGNQLITWGSVESVSPLDQINPRDYEEDIVEPIKIGVPVARLRLQRDEDELSFYWLPYYQHSVYAGPKSYYSISGGMTDDYPKQRWSGDEWAVRYFHPGDGFDIGLSYMQSLERNPDFTFDPALPGIVGDTFRSHRLGVEATRVVGELLLKSEVVYRRSEEEGNKNALLYALGAEYTLVSVWKHSDLTLFAEYLASSRNVKELELMQNDFFAAARWTINDIYKQRLQVGLFVDLDDTDGHVYRFEYVGSPLENLDIGMRYTDTRDYYPGPKHTEDNDEVAYLFARYNF